MRRNNTKTKGWNNIMSKGRTRWDIPKEQGMELPDELVRSWSCRRYVKVLRVWTVSVMLRALKRATGNVLFCNCSAASTKKDLVILSKTLVKERKFCVSAALTDFRFR
tara:strand:- start:451 stop:774 length:324 start_codon:yes stop_codon:yes gene_type:complete